MTENTPEELPIKVQKEVEWYAAALEAWYGTRLELDKSLLTLSAGGIGLLISLVTAFGIESVESLILFILDLGAFVCCMAAVLWILKRNSTHIEQAVHKDQGAEVLLGILDNVAILSFFVGVLLAVIIGVAAAVNSFETKRTHTQMPVKTTIPGMANDSVNGMLNMRPNIGDLGKSFNGVANMAPGAKPAATQPQAATPPAQPSPPAPVPSSSQQGK